MIGYAEFAVFVRTLIEGLESILPAAWFDKTAKIAIAFILCAGIEAAYKVDGLRGTPWHAPVMFANYLITWVALSVLVLGGNDILKAAQQGPALIGAYLAARPGPPEPPDPPPGEREETDLPPPPAPPRPHPSTDTATRSRAPGVTL